MDVGCFAFCCRNVLAIGSLTMTHRFLVPLCDLCVSWVTKRLFIDWYLCEERTNDLKAFLEETFPGAGMPFLEVPRDS